MDLPAARAEGGAALLDLWEAGDLTDVELRCAGGAVRAHRVVLAAASPVFRALFVGAGQAMREGGAPSVDLPALDASALLALLRHVYAGASAPPVAPAAAAPLLAAAAYLAVGPAVAAAAAALRAALKLENAVETLLLAERHDQGALRAEAARFLAERMHEALQAPAAAAALQALPAAALLELLRTDALAVEGEDEVAQAAAAWALGDAEARIPALPELLAAARAPVPPGAARAAAWRAAAALEPRPAEAAARAVAEAAADAATAAAARFAAPGAPPTPPRQGAAVGLIAAGGLDEGWRGVRATEVYDPVADAWRPGAAAPAAASFAAAAALGGDVFVLGGAAHAPAVLTYDRAAALWARGPATAAPRVGAALAALPAAGLVAAGGRAGGGKAGGALRGAERLAPGARAWAPAAPLGAPRAAAAAAALGGRAFVVGGQDDRATVHATVEEYDPARDEWLTLAARMRHARKYLALAAAGGQLVAAGGLTAARRRLASAEALDPREGKWRELPPLAVARSSAGAAALGAEVFVAGGAAGEGGGVLGEVEAWSGAAGRWRRCAPLATARSGLALAPV
jgi:hypothetical protein